MKKENSNQLSIDSIIYNSNFQYIKFGKSYKICKL